MDLKDYMKDLSVYAVSTGFFDKIKVVASDKSILLEAMEKDKEIILKAKFNSPLPELDGEFGLSNLSLLQTITSDTEYTAPESTLNVTYELKSGEKVPSELAYQNKSKSYINYRFMSKQLLPDQPKFVEPKWDLVIKPNKSNIQQFSWAANGLSAYEQYFIPKIDKGNLKFFIGEDNAATQRGGVVFATDLVETYDSQHKWRISHMLNILKAVESCDCEMAFSTKGAIQITLATGVCVYKYIFPAKVR